MEEPMPSAPPGLKSIPRWREHGHFSLVGREFTVMKHWWNLLAIFPLELAGNLFFRVLKKVVYRKVSHGNILLWNFLRRPWGNLLATETVRCYSRQELGAGEVVHTLQEADDGEAVCAPRAGHKKLRNHAHHDCSVREKPSVLHRAAKWAHLNLGGKTFSPAKPLQHQLTANWQSKNICKVLYPFLQSRQGRANFKVRDIQLITDT